MTDDLDFELQYAIDLQKRVDAGELIFVEGLGYVPRRLIEEAKAYREWLRNLPNPFRDDLFGEEP